MNPLFQINFSHTVFVEPYGGITAVSGKRLIMHSKNILVKFNQDRGQQLSIRFMVKVTRNSCSNSTRKMSKFDIFLVKFEQDLLVTLARKCMDN